MIKDTDILKATSKILYEKFDYKIFIDKNSKEVKAPSFFVSITPLTSENYKEFNQKSRKIHITYTNLSPQQEELLDIENSLDELFSVYIKVNDISLQIKNKKFNLQDEFITIIILVDFKDSKENITEPAKMGNLNLNMK